jgi:hypothetical protein
VGGAQLGGCEYLFAVSRLGEAVQKKLERNIREILSTLLKAFESFSGQLPVLGVRSTPSPAPACCPNTRACRKCVEQSGCALTRSNAMLLPRCIGNHRGHHRQLVCGGSGRAPYHRRASRATQAPVRCPPPSNRMHVNPALPPPRCVDGDALDRVMQLVPGQKRCAGPRLLQRRQNGAELHGANALGERRVDGNQVEVEPGGQAERRKFFLRPKKLRVGGLCAF